MRRRFFVSGLVIVTLVALCAFALRSKALRSNAPSVKTQEVVTMKVGDKEAKMAIRNNTADNRWIDVPIQIFTKDGYNYQITNVTDKGINVPPMTVKRFMLAIYAGKHGAPLHGNGSERHYSPVKVTDRPLPPGESVTINIHEQLTEFATMQHEHADLTRMEIWPEIIDFADDGGPAKRWRGGEYLRSTGDGGWERDSDLNPKVNRNLAPAASATQGCYVYDYSPPLPCKPCNDIDPICNTPYCWIVYWKFQYNLGGVRTTSQCGVRCTLLTPQGQCDEFGTQCARGDGSPCTTPVIDLDYDNPC